MRLKLTQELSATISLKMGAAPGSGDGPEEAGQGDRQQEQAEQ